MVCQVSKSLPLDLSTITNAFFWRQHAFVLFLLKDVDGGELFLHQRTLHVNPDHLGWVENFTQQFLLGLSTGEREDADHRIVIVVGRW